MLKYIVNPKAIFMSQFLRETLDWARVELEIDVKIFNAEIVLKSSYNFLDRWYFFFKYNAVGNLLLEVTRKPWNEEDLKNLVWDFSDSLLETTLRDKLEKDNKIIRENIVEKAINGPLDTSNFVTLDTDNLWSVQNEIDFDKDIDEILKEIENDPELKIDEWEIANILKEIEEEWELSKPEIKADLWAVADLKAQFKNK